MVHILLILQVVLFLPFLKNLAKYSMPNVKKNALVIWKKLDLK